MTVFLSILAIVLVVVLSVLQHRKIRMLSSSIDSLNRDLKKLNYDLQQFKESLQKRSDSVSPASTEPETTPPSVVQEPPRQRAVPPPMPPISKPPVNEAKPQLQDRTQTPAINWERFMGVNLFAWVGGFALFLGAAFFLKYSIDNNLISAEIRVLLGFVLAAGLLAGGLRLSTRNSPVTAQTLCSTGILVLYVDIYASHYFYNFFGITFAFLLMIAVTAAAFWLAVHLNARLVAVLGLLGGFLTPPVLSTGKDNPLALFSYIFVLNCGLIGIALKKKWNFLALFGAIATILIQAGWAAKYFSVPKVWNAWFIFSLFQIQFVLALKLAKTLQRTSASFSASALLMPLFAIIFSFSLLFSRELVETPLEIFSFVLISELCLIAAVVIRSSLQPGHTIAGIAIFFLITIWLLISKTPPLKWALGLPVAFALVHTAFPLVLRRFDPGAKGQTWSHVFPVLSLMLVLALIFKSSDVPFSAWFAVFAVNVLAVAAAIYTSSVRSLIGALLMTLITMSVWIFRTPEAAISTFEPFILITMVSGFMTIATAFAARSAITQGTSEQQESGQSLAGVPVLSAILPFLLLIFVILKIKALEPALVFSAALILGAVLIAVWRWTKLHVLTCVALGCVLAVEYFWYSIRFHPASSASTIVWIVLFYAIFTALPFAFTKSLRNTTAPWAVSAASGPLHFYLMYGIVKQTYDPNWIGILPAILAIPPLLGLWNRAADTAADAGARRTQIALLGASSLFFITLVFPVQFEKQWITIGWALEGAMLLWLYHRITHPGLKWAGSILLLAAFARLALNPAVLSYYERSATPILNWYLYTYAIVIVCLIAGAKLIYRLGAVNMRGVLYTLAAVLAFLLLNIEIADYFSEGRFLVFQFSGNFARDMTYSISWALFAFLILTIGIRKRVPAARYAAIALIGLTLLKLFLHDLSNLNQLYRVGALVSIAIILILASYLYQRYVSFEPDAE